MVTSISYKNMLLHPMLQLTEDWQVKAVLAAATTLGIGLFKQILGLYGELFTAEPILILFLITLIIADLFAGSYRSIVSGVRFSPKRFVRSAGIKIGEYLGVCYVLIGLSNAFDDIAVIGPIVGELGNFGLLWACWSEGVSVIENATGSKRAFTRLAKFVSKFNPDAPVARLLEDDAEV